MIPNLPRKQVQLLSFLLFAAGALVIIAGGWQNEAARSVGITLMAGSIWFIMMAESVLLGKVQTEMTRALESFRKKQEVEIQDLLYFLRQSRIAASPLESIDGAKKLCSTIHYPAMVLTISHQIIKANEKMHNLVGWGEGELNGKPAHFINDLVVMSKIGERCAMPEHVDKKAMITQYVYVHRSGKKIFGQMDAAKIGDDGYFVVFHPSKDCVISYDEIRKMSMQKENDTYDSAIAEFKKL